LRVIARKIICRRAVIVNGGGLRPGERWGPGLKRFSVKES